MDKHSMSMVTTDNLRPLLDEIEEEMRECGKEVPGKSYVYEFGEKAAPWARALGWRFTSHVRRAHSRRPDLPPELAAMFPEIVLPARDVHLREITGEDVDSIVRVRAMIASGLQKAPRQLYVERRDNNAVFLPVDAERHAGDMGVVVREDMRRVILTEVGDPEARHDRIIMDGSIYGHNTMERRMGDTFVVVAQVVERVVKRTSSFFLECLDVYPVDDTPKWTPEVAEAMAIGEQRTQDFLGRLAWSLAPATGKSNLAAKVSVLLSAVNSPPLADERPNIHTLLVGPPGTGKTAACYPMAMEVAQNAEFLDGPASSGRGLTFAQVTIAGENTVTPGALVRCTLVVVDEIGRMRPSDLDEIHGVMEKQFTSYMKALKAKQATNCSIIATANPDEDRWHSDLTLTANLPTLKAALLSRFNIFMFRGEENTERKYERAVSAMLGDALEPSTAFTRQQLAAYIARARTLNPQFSDEWRKVVVDYVVQTSSDDGKISDIGRMREVYGERLLAMLIRNAGGFARLLHKGSVDAHCGRLAIWLLEESMASLWGGLDTAVPDTGVPAAGDPAGQASPSRSVTKAEAAVYILEEMNRVSPSGWAMSDAEAELVKAYPRHFSDQISAHRYIWVNFEGCLLRQKADRFLFTRRGKEGI